MSIIAGNQSHSPKARLPTESDRLYRRLDVLHRVVDGEARGDGAAWRVDVDLNLLFRRIRREVHELRDDQVGHDVVDGPADDDDPVLQQPRVDIESALAVAALVLDDRRYVSQREWQLTRNPSRGRQASPAGPPPLHAAIGRRLADDALGTAGMNPAYIPTSSENLSRGRQASPAGPLHCMQ